MAETVLGNAIDFFKEFGLFDIVLPFLLIFTISFALLEKSRILGVEGSGDKATSKKNLNAMVAFVLGLLVVTANKVVNAINTALPNIVFLIIILISFLLLIGTFFKTGELEFFKEYSWTKIIFMIVLLILVILIFLNSIPTSTGESWLSYAFNYTLNNFSGAIVTSLIVLVVVIIAILIVVGTGKSTTGAK